MTSELTTARVLVIDDDPASAALVRDLLTDAGYQATIAGGAEQALKLTANRAFEVVITDLRMPTMDGFQLMEQLQQQDPMPAIIAMTGFGTVDAGLRALRAGAAAFLVKPFEACDLASRVAEVLARRAARIRNARLREEVDALRVVATRESGQRR